MDVRRKCSSFHFIIICVFFVYVCSTVIGSGAGDLKVINDENSKCLNNKLFRVQPAFNAPYFVGYHHRRRAIHTNNASRQPYYLDEFISNLATSFCVLTCKTFDFACNYIQTLSFQWIRINVYQPTRCILFLAYFNYTANINDMRENFHTLSKNKKTKTNSHVIN